MITFIVRNEESPDSPKEYSFEKKLIKIGRLDENDIILKENYISRQHFLVIYDEGKYKIIDTSKNGTLLNGELLSRDQEKILKTGDNIKIGDFSINVIIK